VRLARAAKVARILKANKLRGDAAEELVERTFLQSGFELVGRRVSIVTSKGRRQIDRLFRDSSNRLFAVEVKSGGAVRSAEQVVKDRLLATQGGRFVGKNAGDLAGSVERLDTLVVTVK